MFPTWKQTDWLTVQRPGHCKPKWDLEPEDKGYTNKWYVAICFGVIAFTVQKSGKLSNFWRAEHNAPDSNLTTDTQKKNMQIMQYSYLWQGFSIVRQASKLYIRRYQSLGSCFCLTRIHFSYLKKPDLYGPKWRHYQKQSRHAARLFGINLWLSITSIQHQFLQAAGITFLWIKNNEPEVCHPHVSDY